MSAFRGYSDDERGFSLVELLVVIGLASLLGTAIMTVLISTIRTERFTDDLRTVMDDGRVSLARVRKELRAARKVLPGSDSTALHFWVDQDQDNDIDSGENRWYCVRPVGATQCVDATNSGGDSRFELVRWTESESAWDGTTLPRTPPSSARVIAATLRNHQPLLYCELPNDTCTQDPVESRVVAVEFALDVKGERGPEVHHVAATVRLRNVD